MVDDDEEGGLDTQFSVRVLPKTAAKVKEIEAEYRALGPGLVKRAIVEMGIAAYKKTGELDLMLLKGHAPLSTRPRRPPRKEN